MNEDNQRPQPEEIWKKILEELKQQTGEEEEIILTSNQFQFKLIWKLEKEGRFTKRLTQIKNYLSIRDREHRSLPEEHRKELRKIFFYQLSTRKPARTGTSLRERKFSKYDSRVRYDPYCLYRLRTRAKKQARSIVPIKD
jgi:hypothetical protein